MGEGFATDFFSFDLIGRLGRNINGFEPTGPSRLDDFPVRTRVSRCRGAWAGALSALLFGMAGCAFDLVTLKQSSVEFYSAKDGQGFVLLQDLRVHLGTGFPTLLRANTQWEYIGSTKFGDVLGIIAHPAGETAIKLAARHANAIGGRPFGTKSQPVPNCNAVEIRPDPAGQK